MFLLIWIIGGWDVFVICLYFQSIFFVLSRIKYEHGHFFRKNFLLSTTFCKLPQRTWLQNWKVNILCKLVISHTNWSPCKISFSYFDFSSHFQKEHFNFKYPMFSLKIISGLKNSVNTFQHQTRWTKTHCASLNKSPMVSYLFGHET